MSEKPSLERGKMFLFQGTDEKVVCADDSLCGRSRGQSEGTSRYRNRSTERCRLSINEACPN